MRGSLCGNRRPSPVVASCICSLMPSFPTTCLYFFSHRPLASSAPLDPRFSGGKAEGTVAAQEEQERRCSHGQRRERAGEGEETRNAGSRDRLALYSHLRQKEESGRRRSALRSGAVNRRREPCR